MASSFDQYTNSDKQSAFFEILRNKCESAGGLTMHATNKYDLKTVSAIAYAIGGKFYSLAATASISMGTLAPGSLTYVAGSTYANRAGVFFFVNAAGTISCSGLVSASPSDGLIYCPTFDAATKVCFGSIKIVNGTAATVFVSGTTLLDAGSGLVVTYNDHNQIIPGHAI